MRWFFANWLVHLFSIRKNEINCKRGYILSRVSPQITIATVAFNSLPYTQLFFKYLKKNADIPYHLIVVDNHSTDETTKFLSQQKEVEVIYNQRNLGFAQANNQAFRRTKTEFFLGINNDTVLFPGFLSALLKAAHTYPQYGEFGVHSNCIGAIDPRTKKSLTHAIPRPQNPTLQNLTTDIESIYGDMDTFFKEFSNSKPEIEDLECPPNFIGGWCFFLRTQDIPRKEKLFDPRYRIGFWEDVDLSWKIAQRGKKIGLLKNIYLHHFVHASFENGKQKQSDHLISKHNALEFAQKWSSSIRMFLSEKLNEGFTLSEICEKYFIFRAYFGKQRNDWETLEIRLKQEFIETQHIDFKDFLKNKPPSLTPYKKIPLKDKYGK